MLYYVILQTRVGCKPTSSWGVSLGFPNPGPRLPWRLTGRSWNGCEVIPLFSLKPSPCFLKTECCCESHLFPAFSNTGAMIKEMVCKALMIIRAHHCNWSWHIAAEVLLSSHEKNPASLPLPCSELSDSVTVKSGFTCLGCKILQRFEISMDAIGKIMILMAKETGRELLMPHPLDFRENNCSLEDDLP